MKLYWPTKGIGSIEGHFVGWRLRGDSLVVVSTVRDTETTQDVLRSDTHRKLAILGRILHLSNHQEDVSSSEEDLILCVDSSGIPTSSNKSIDVILFEPPDPSRLRFFSLGHDQTKTGGTRQRSELSPSTSSNHGIADVLPLLNEVKEVQIELHTSKRTPGAKRGKARTSASANPGASEMVDDGAGPRYPGGYMSRAFDIVCNKSALVAQTALRTSQLFSTPRRFRATLHHPEIEIFIRSKRYMSFWNTVWLILNDLILGYCARQMILQLSSTVTPYISYALQTYACQSVVAALNWLNDWPIGLKLNTPLSHFFCQKLGTIISVWADSAVPAFTQHIPTIMSLLAWTSLGGLTFTIAAVQDLLALGILHLYLCYRLTSTTCQWQLSSLRSLWNLFRGKRWNVLRQRTDSYAYDVDQLFLGTLLFTVSIFLLPTVAIYALLFALIRISFVSIYRVLHLGIVALNAFPLFELMLLVKEPSRLPGGLTIDRKRVSTPITGQKQLAHAVAQVLVLKNKPKSLTSILSTQRNA